MWIKKLPHEIEKDEKNYLNPIKPIICAVFIFLVLSISVKIGFCKWDIPSINPISWDEFFEWGIKKSFGLSLVFGLIFYLWQLITKKQILSGDPLLICERCKTIKNFDNVLSCQCGGKFIKLNKMKWNKDKSNL